jgi:hypothetical protein
MQSTMTRSLLGVLGGADVLADLVFLKSRRRTELAVPEKALMLAVLAEAIEIYQRYACSQSASRQALFREVEAWFFGKQADYIFSFPVICEVLALDAEYLRRGLMQWRAHHQHDRSARKTTQVHSVRSSTRKQIGIPAKRVTSSRQVVPVPR